MMGTYVLTIFIALLFLNISCNLNDNSVQGSISAPSSDSGDSDIGGSNFLSLETAADGTGTAVTSANFNIYQADSYYIILRDSDGNFLENVSASINSSGSGLTVTTVGGGTQLDLEATTNGSNSIEISYQGLELDIPITVVPPTQLTVNSTSQTNDDDPGDGVCMDSGGNCTLHAAIMEANALPAGTVIEISIPGGTINLPNDLPVITSNVRLLGQAMVTLDANPDATPLNKTIWINATTDPLHVQIENLTIEHAVSTDIASSAIWYQGTISGGSLDVSDSVIRNNTTTSNTAIGVGATVNNGVDSVWDNVHFENNQHTGFSTGHGGGLSLGDGDHIVRNSYFGNNQARNFGGGIHSVANSLLIERCHFDSNITPFQVSSGGSAVMTQSAGESFVIRGSYFTGNNAAVQDWGTISDEFLIENTTFYDNDFFNVEIFADDTTVDRIFRNVTFITQGAGHASLSLTPGFGADSPDIYFEHVTTDGEIELSGGGGDADIYFKHSILADTGGNNCTNFGGTINPISLGYNVMGEDTGDECFVTGGTGDLTNVPDPLLVAGAPADNGSSFVIPDGAGGTMNLPTVALMAPSPARNIIPAGVCDITEDARGTARPVGGSCDAGATEQ